MLIGGLQKLSLSDFPGRIAAIIFTQGCNLRCGYCHNPSLVDPSRFGPTLDEGDVLRFLESRRGKLDGVVMSGGEPCLQPDLLDAATRIVSMGFALKLDTNGTVPGPVEALLSKRLVHHVAMDLKAPPADYERIAGTSVDVDAVLATLGLLKASGVPFEVRTTWTPDLFPATSFLTLASLLRDVPRYFIQPANITDGNGASTPVGSDGTRRAAVEAVRSLRDLGVRAELRGSRAG